MRLVHVLSVVSVLCIGTMEIGNASYGNGGWEFLDEHEEAVVYSQKMGHIKRMQRTIKREVEEQMAEMEEIHTLVKLCEAFTMATGKRHRYCPRGNKKVVVKARK